MIGVQAADLPASGSGEYFIKNVETGTFLKGDMYWGTKACVWDDPYLLTLTYVSEGVYTIKSQQNNGGQNQYITAGDDPFVDGAAANMTFTEVDAENHYFTINNGTGNLTAVSQTEDGVQLYKVMPTTETSTLAQWQVVSRAELVAELDNASASNPVNATFFLKDAGIDVKSVNANAWTTSNVDLGGGGNAGHSAESWNKANFNLSQTVTGLPNGKYRVECYGYYRWNNGSTNNNAAAVAAHANGTEVLNAKFFAGAKETPLMSVAGDANATAFCQTMGWADNTPNSQWQAAACFDKGYYKNTLEDVVVTDGTLTIGVKKDTQAGTDWAVFDEFKLFYLGEDLSIYVEAYSDAKTAANAVNQTAPMKADVLSALQTAIATYGEGVDETNKDALLTATSALNSATSAASNSVNAYAAAAVKLNAMQALTEATNVYTAEAYAAYYGDPKAKFDARTMTNEEANALENPTTITGWRASNKVDDLLMSAFDEATEKWDSYHINTWSAEGESDGSNFKVPFYEYWTGDENSLAAKTCTGTLTGLENGTYEVRAWVRVRAKNGVAVADATGITMKASDGAAVDVTEGEAIGTSQFQLATYIATGYVTNGTLSLDFDIAADNNISWLSFKNVKYTRTGDLPAADAEDYAALNAALNAVAGNVVGFEDGEYAPYNNKEAVAALNAAKAIDQSAVNVKSVVQAATAALTGAVWTANATEVNAIYWKTDYTAGDKAADNYVHPIGWTNTGYNTRIMCAANDAKDNPAMTTIGTAVFSKYNTTYGEVDGYTLPLKAGKIYKITFKYCGWGNNPTTNIVLRDPESNTITLAPGFKPATSDGNTNAEHWYDYTGYFVSTTAGNYVLAMNKVDDGQQQIAWANMQIVSAPELEFAEASVPTYAPGTYPSVKITRTLTANRWATAVYPFAVSGVDNIAVLDSYNSGTGVISFATAAASTANEPFLMRSTEGTTEISLSNVAVAATAANPVATKSEASLKGVYASGKVPESEGNDVRYVVSSNQLYKVDSEVNIKPFRAYFEFIGNKEARPVLRFDDTTAINAIEAAEAEAGTLKDGKYIIDNKVVIVKNGVKYGANGQKLN